jgi:3-methyladenine DNA glycosylase/8-oxoguanine DNA glycosylase
MIAIFYLGKTNIWSEKDLILNRGIHELCDKSEINPEKLLALIDPYQSYLALHLWRDKD